MLRLGRIAREDAVWYVPAQLAGAVAGMLLASAVLGPLLAAPAVHYVVTRPGMQGILAAFVAEALISSVLLTCVLESNASPRLGRYTGLVAGALVATFIVCEAPLSGMSMNPARSFGSAVAALDWTSLWIYFAAPPLGMFLAAQRFLWRRGSATGVCAKLRPHRPGEPCQLCASVDVPASLTSNAGTIRGLL
jgi:aquaporin Z